MSKGIDLLPAVLPDAAPSIDTETGPPDIDKPYRVILYNCSCHTFDDVEVQLQKATGCNLEKAQALAMEVHVAGRAVVFDGSARECEKVANILRAIRLQVETDTA